MRADEFIVEIGLPKFDKDSAAMRFLKGAGVNIHGITKGGEVEGVAALQKEMQKYFTKHQDELARGKTQLDLAKEFLIKEKNLDEKTATQILNQMKDALTKSIDTDPDHQPTPGEPVATPENTPVGHAQALQSPVDSNVWYVITNTGWAKWIDNEDGTFECINLITSNEWVDKIDSLRDDPKATVKPVFIKKRKGGFYQFITKRKKDA